MKTMRNVLMLSLLLAGTGVFAQQEMKVEPMRADKMRQGRLLEQLDLSPEQKARIQELNKEYAQKDSVNFAEFRQKNEQNRVERMNAFKSTLTKEQLEKFESLMLMRADREIFNRNRKDDKREIQEVENLNPVERIQKPEQSGKLEAKSSHNDNHDGKSKHVSKKVDKIKEKQSRPIKIQTRAQSAPASAHIQKSGMTPQQHAQKQTLKLTKELRLNASQSAGVYKICLRHAVIKATTGKDKKGLKHREINRLLNAGQKRAYGAYLHRADKETN
jgi:hypothetical protein